MIADGQLGKHGMVTLLVFALVAHLFLGLPRILAVQFQTGGWIALTVGLLVTAIGIIPLLAFVRRFPDTSFAGAVEQTLGPIISIPVSLAFATVFYANAALATAVFVRAFDLLYYPDTPRTIIVGLVVAAVGYNIYAGVENAGRVAVLVRAPLAVSLLFLGAFVPSGFSFQELTPVWGISPEETLMGGVGLSGLFAPIAISAVYFAYLRPSDRRPLTAYAALLIGGLFTIGITAVITTVLPVPAVAETNLPMLEVVRLVEIGELIQRIEAAFLFIWFFVSVVALTAMAQPANIVVAETLHLPGYKPIVPVMSVIAFFIIFLPRSLAQAEMLFYGWIVPAGAVVAYGGGAVLWLVAAVRRKGIVPRA